MIYYKLTMRYIDYLINNFTLKLRINAFHMPEMARFKAVYSNFFHIINNYKEEDWYKFHRVFIIFSTIG